LPIRDNFSISLLCSTARALKNVNDLKINYSFWHSVFLSRISLSLCLNPYTSALHVVAPSYLKKIIRTVDIKILNNNNNNNNKPIGRQAGRQAGR
jgi:hypothetical protein